MVINIKDILCEESSTNIELGELRTIGIYKVNNDSCDFSSTAWGIYKSPPIPLDVKSCYESCTTHCPNIDENKIKFKELVKFLAKNPSLLINSESKVITLRRTMAKILQMPNDVGLHDEDFRFKATKFKPNLFIDSFKLLKKQELRKEIAVERTENKIFKLNCISGLNGEEIVDSVINQVNHPCVYARKLGDLTIIFSCSTAPLSSIENNEQKFVEIKLLRAELNLYKFYTKRKLMKWWCNYFISNIDLIYIGILKPDGKVKRHPEKIQIADLRQICKNYWVPEKLLSYAYKFLKMIANIIEEIEDPCIIYEFYFNSKYGTISWKQLKVNESEVLLTDEFIASQQ